MEGKQLKDVTLQIKRGTDLTSKTTILEKGELALDQDNNMLYAGNGQKSFNELEHIGTDTVKAKGLTASPEGTTISEGAVIGVGTLVAGGEIKNRTNGNPTSGETIESLNLTNPTVDTGNFHGVDIEGSTVRGTTINNNRTEITNEGLSKIALQTDMYGQVLPSSGVEGDLFFLIS